jgi:hypothetical protein
VYVSPYPVTGAKVAVSTASGNRARWRRDGRELFFISGDRKLMASTLDTAGLPGPPRPLFDVAAWVDYDVSRDDRFVAVVSEVVTSTQPLAVLVNWHR